MKQKTNIQRINKTKSQFLKRLVKNRQTSGKIVQGKNRDTSNIRKGKGVIMTDSKEIKI